MLSSMKSSSSPSPSPRRLDTYLADAHTVLGLILFAVEAAFSLLLYLEIADGVWYYQAIYGIMSVCFDSALMILWIRGCYEKRFSFRAIALGFALITFIAAGASALAIVERKADAVRAESSAVEAARAEITSLDADLDTNRRAIDKTPDDFTTRLRELNVVSAELRSARTRASERLAAALVAAKTSTSAKSTAMFDLVARLLRVDAGVFKLVFLLATSAMLIIGSLALTAPSKATAVSSSTVTYGDRIHVLRRGRALCGKPPSPPAVGPTRPCDICFKRHFATEEASRA